MPKNIFQLALDFYRSPTEFGELVDTQKPVPEGIGELLAFLTGPDHEKVKIIGSNVALQGAGELFDAASYFVEEVLFVPGADYYRLLGLRSDAGGEQVKRHYQLLISLFYQEEKSSMVNWKESDSMRVNQAYSVLRDAEKRRNYDNKLTSLGRQIDRFDPATYKASERGARARNDETPTVQASANSQDVTLPGLHGVDEVRRDAEKVLADAVRLASGNAAKKPRDAAEIQEAPTVVAPRPAERAVAAAGAEELPKILICDDSATVRASLAKALANDFRCLRARNGDEAWRLLQDNPDVSLILTDLEMPEMDGYALISKIRNSGSLPLANLPIIIVTSATDTQAKQAALGMGASDFLAKGTDYVEMLARVRVHYRLSQTMVQQAKAKTPGLSKAVPPPARDLDDDKTVLLKVRPESVLRADRERERPQISARDDAEKPHQLPKPVLVGAVSLVIVIALALIFSRGSDEPTGKAQDATASRVEQPVAAEATGNEAKEGEQAVSSDETIAAAGPQGTDAVTPLDAVKPEVIKTQSAAVADSHADKVMAPPTSASDNAAAEKNNRRANNNSLAESLDIIPRKPAPLPLRNEPPVAPTNTGAGGLSAEPAVTNELDDQHIRERLAAIDAERAALVAREEKLQPGVDATKVPDKADSNTTLVATAAGNNLAGKAQPDGIAADPGAAPQIGDLSAEPAADSPQVAKVDPEPAKPQVRDLISSTELSILLFKFIRAYEEGNLFQFLGLFDSDARTEDSVGIKEIRRDYELLFKKSDMRQFIIQNMEWQKSGIRAIGKGSFQVKIKGRGSDRVNAQSGTVTFHVVKRADELFVTELYYSYSQ